MLTEDAKKRRILKDAVASDPEFGRDIGVKPEVTPNNPTPKSKASKLYGKKKD